MRLTPLDIRKQEFSRGIRGYEAEEVDAFLQMISNQWEEMLDDVRRKSEEIRDLEAKLSHYEKVEEALQEALQTARETSKKAIENAEQKAALLVREAEARADDIKREAEIERHELKRETSKLSSRRSEIVTRLRAFLMSEMELLARYEGDDPVGFIRLLPAEQQRLEQKERPTTHDEPSKHVAGSTESEDSAGRDEPRTKPEEEDIPEDVTAADHAQFNRPRHTRQETDQPAVAETDDARELEEREDAGSEGWTTHTFVGGAPGGRGDEARGEAKSGTDDDDELDKASSEEIEKIRRILSDLD